LLASYLHDLSPFIFQVGGWGPRWYGVAYVLSFLVGYLVYRWLARRGYTEMPEEKVADFVTLAAIFGVMLGGRLGWILFYGWRDVAEDPLSALKVWEGGMSSHGGMLGLVVLTYWFARRHHLSWTGIGDNLCVVAPIGLFIVRCANFINGELYGRPAGPPGGPASVPWAVIFPTELGKGMPPLEAIRHNEIVRQTLRETLPPRHPSQLYEAFLEGVVLFLILWFLRTRMRVSRGVITGAFFILYAALRIIGEFFREPDPSWHVGPISAGQFLSFFLVVLGAAFLFHGVRKREYERAVAPVTP
jgi:phosphatidylglycerol:prolipoprotein diacylglycerol transferase